MTPPPATPSAPQELPPLSESGSMFKKMLTWIAVLFILVGGGYALYVYGWPYINSLLEQTAPPETDTVAAAPLTETPPTTEVISPPPASAPTTSVFGTPLSAVTPVSLTELILPSIRAELEKASTAQSAQGGVQEITLATPTGPLTFSAYVSALIPEAQGAGLTELFNAAFEPSFSSYIFHDSRGAWPGYVVQLKPTSGIDIVTLTDRLQKLETVSYANFFITPPGAPQEFKTGQALQKYTDRYVSFETPGALFSYGLFGNYLIINTSNEGLKQALQKLAL